MSIATQQYPKDLIQLILVNHLSDDNTGLLMENSRRIPRSMCRLSISTNLMNVSREKFTH